MAFFQQALSVLQTLVVLIGGAIAAHGLISWLESYASDNPGGRSQGIKQTFAGGGIIIVGLVLVPVLSSLL